MIITEESQKRVAVMRIMDLNLEKGSYEVTIKKKSGKRSLSQNALFWLWMKALEKDSETGYSKEEWHDIFQSMFCPRTEVWVGETKVEKIRGTSSLTKDEMKDLLNRIEHFSYHELNFSLPNPDDYRFDQFIEQYEDYL